MRIDGDRPGEHDLGMTAQALVRLERRHRKHAALVREPDDHRPADSVNRSIRSARAPENEEERTSGHWD
ncbi:MAG TPA: hypothetical protein VFO81_01520 [Gaiellaceae bacterium]|nr:hypothetical protein [Gaiellaceae bacterium]